MVWLAPDLAIWLMFLSARVGIGSSLRALAAPAAFLKQLIVSNDRFSIRS